LPPDQRPSITPRFIVGVFLVLIGIALTLDQLGLVPAHHMMRFWPAVLIVLGLSILQRGRRRGAVGGVVLVIVGTWLLLNTLGLVSLDLWEFLWPLILVVVGVRIMMRGGRRSSADPRFSPSPMPPLNPNSPLNQNSPGNPNAPPNPGAAPESGLFSSVGCGTQFSDHSTQFAILGSCRRRWGTTTFRSAEATSIMGGCELDLRNALLPAQGPAQIEVFVLMGGINIFVPPNWTVVTEVVPILGGVHDKTRTSPSNPAQQLIIRGTVMMGGVEISN
jgi:predicted membrane protein